MHSFGVHNIVQYNEDQLWSYTQQKTHEAMRRGDARRAQIQTLEELSAYQAQIRHRFLEGIGGLPQRGEVLSTLTGTFVVDGLICENRILETLPGWYATVSIYKPADAQGALPAILMACGHSPEARLRDAYQREQRILAKAGFVVLGLDPTGQGERWSYVEDGFAEPTIGPGTHDHDYTNGQLMYVGLSIARYFVHDAICALDYLASRPDVLADKIGMTGVSGGGTQTLMMSMAAGDRLAAVAPGIFVTDREALLDCRQSQDAEQIWPGLAAAGIDHADTLACMAPKPVAILAADSDFFPLEGVHRTLDRMKNLWSRFGAADNVELFVDETTHACTVGLANAAADFFSRVLKGMSAAYVPDTEISPMSDLYATPTGSVVRDLGGKTGHDFAVEELERIRMELAGMSDAQRRQRALEWLAPKLARRDELLYIKKPNDWQLFFNCWTRPLCWKQEEGLYGFGLLLSPDKKRHEKFVIAAWEGGTDVVFRQLDRILRWIQSGYDVLVVDLAASGSLSGNINDYMQPNVFYSDYYSWYCNLLVLDDSLVALRTRGLCRAADVLEELFGAGRELQIAAVGNYSLYALLAKLTDARVTDLQLVDPPQDFAHQVERKYYSNDRLMERMLPGMLRYFDIPDLVEWTKESADFVQID